LFVHSDEYCFFALFHEAIIANVFCHADAVLLTHKLVSQRHSGTVREETVASISWLVSVVLDIDFHDFLDRR